MVRSGVYPTTVMIKCSRSHHEETILFHTLGSWRLVYAVPAAHSICGIWLADRILQSSERLEKHPLWMHYQGESMILAPWT